MAAWTDADWPSGSKSFAVPIGKFQSDILRALAAQRSPDSYIAGGVAINREGPRFSGDIDIFHDSEARLESAAKDDTAALTAAGYSVTWERVREGKRDATVARGGEAMLLEWVTDAASRFFPTQPDELFGYVLHPVDLAANKASAAADRRVPREDAESFVAKLPSDAVGVIFMDGEKPVQPDVNALDKYQRNPGAVRGFWPSSPEISRAMLERYGERKP
jgi:hypothetical protein